MDLKNLASTIEKFSPILASIIPFPAARFILDAIANSFNGSSQNPEDLANKINNDQSSQIKLKQIELENNLQIQQILSEVDLAKQQVIDKQSARDAESKRKDYSWIQPVLAIIVTIGLIFLVTVVLFTNMDQSDHDVLSNAIGVIEALAGMIISFYFGSAFIKNK